MTLKRYIIGCHYLPKHRMSKIVQTQKVVLLALWITVIVQHYRKDSGSDKYFNMSETFLSNRDSIKVKEVFYSALLLQNPLFQISQYNDWKKVTDNGDIYVTEKGKCRGFFSYNSTATINIAVNRETNDNRPSKCAQEYSGLNYDWLPSVSVVIPFHNEQLSTLARTVFSILRHSPAKVLKEVILVDDFSTTAELTCLGEELEKVIFTLEGKVKLVRNTIREGSTRTRIIGASYATGDIISYVDSHVEVNAGWLEPIVTKIKRSPKTVVMSILDTIDDNTFDITRTVTGYHGGFTWSLDFFWKPLPDHVRAERHEETDPMPSPIMPAGAFAVDREFFIRVGLMDTDMKIWGVDDVEFSFRVWQCGGRVEILPCSRVAHVFRKRIPYSFQFSLHCASLHTLRAHHVVPTAASRCALYRWSVNSSSRLRPAVLYGYTSRHNSSGTTATTTTVGAEALSSSPPAGLPDGYIPDRPPLPDAPDMSELAQPVLNALGEPTLSSLGLCNMTPPGLVQTALETMHVGFDMPWWGAIVAGTVFVRLCMFPLVIMGQRNAANMSNHMPTVTRLQERFTKARLGGNPLEAARAYSEMSEYMTRNKVNPLKNFMVPLAQMPIFISVFVGLRKMANLPVESMTTGGLLWFTDLTIPDPLFIMPFLTMGTFLITIELGVDGVKAQTMTHTMKWVMRAMPVLMLPFIINFPSAMLCYWFTTNFFSLCQVGMLRIPGMKQRFNIPEVIDHAKADKKLQKPAPKKGFVKGFKETWSNSKLMAQLEERQKVDTQKFTDAGKAPIVKTYKKNPKLSSK